jgi:hypothetical protein
MGRVAVIGRTLSSNAPRMWAMLRSPEMKGTLSHLPQRAPSKSEDRGITVGLAGGGLQNVDCTEQQLHYKLFQAPGDQDRTGRGIIDRVPVQCNGRMQSRIMAFFQTASSADINMQSMRLSNPHTHRRRPMARPKFRGGFASGGGGPGRCWVGG